MGPVDLLPLEEDIPGYAKCVRGGAEEASLRKSHAVEAILALPSIGEWGLGHALFCEEAFATLTEENNMAVN